MPDSTVKNFVLDTNVLIHNPSALYSFADNNIIIPITVIEELDKFKSHSDKKGMHARQALREIDAQIKRGALKKGAKMKNGGTLKLSLGKDLEDIPHMDPALNDNKILAAAWKLQQSGKSVFFISKDVNARIKSEALGIKAADYEKQKVEYSSLYKGWREIKVPSDTINELYASGSIEIKGYTFFCNEFVLLKSEEDDSQSAMCKMYPQENSLRLIRPADEAMGIIPLNLEQRFAFHLLLDESIKLITLVGQAGTGKTLIAIACGLKQILGKRPAFKKLLVARPIIPMGKDIGYLPGSKDEKMNYWMQPVFDNLDFILHGRKSTDDKSKEAKKSEDKVDKLIKSNILEIEALTYIRGRSIPDQFLIVDEAQNLTPHEVKTIISRVGEGTKIILTGDPEQIDNPYLDSNSNGLSYSVERLKNIDIVGHIFLSKSERSELASLAVENL
ncbi:MAG: PhoH family protein [Fibrobacterota bacterium]